ncbi:endonuclease/exonuclease/phosphatase family protein [Opitutales bacterium]|nr:endonuclease/exonuclease/phosphatase family protein [Opitutales bacterium]
MSFNIRNGLAKDGENAWPLRQAFVVETIRTFDPDLLGLQEVHRFQADYLIEQLPGYDFYGVARDDGKVKGEIVPVMVKRDRFEMIESGHYWLSETPEVIGSKGWDSALPRLASWTLIRDKQGNDKPFIFGNTHWDHRGQVARLESAKLIRKRIDSVLPEIPVIVTGDFNTHEKLDPYAELVTSTGSSGAPLLDTYRVIHPQVRDLEGTFSAFTGERARNRIDWILTSQDFVTLNASINYTQENGRYPSDHYPVDAVVRLK